MPRLIDGSPVALNSVESSNSIGMSYSVFSERQRTRCRKTRSDIIEEYHGINEEDKAFMTLYSMNDKFSYLDGKKRKEATQQEKPQLAKQFLDAKKAECQSWIDNEVFDLVDMRKTKVRNFVAGRWVLTVKKDKDVNFQKCKARWVLKGFQDKQKNTQQTDSPAASRAGFRCATQLAANYSWDLYNMDLKTAFLQGEAYDETRDIICQIPPEYGYPPYIGARLKKLGYGLNDAPRHWCQIIDKALLDSGLVPTRADRCTYVLYGNTSKNRTYQPPRSVNAEQVNISAAIDHLMDPVARNNAQGRRPHGFICNIFMIHVDDLLFAGSTDLWNNKFLKGMTQRFNVSHSELKEDGSSISFFKRCLVKLAYGLMIVPGTTVEKVVSCFEKSFGSSRGQKVPCDAGIQNEDHSQALNASDGRAYRSVIGLLLYVARKRVDIMFTVKELAACMSAPTLCSL